MSRARNLSKLLGADGAFNASDINTLLGYTPTSPTQLSTAVANLVNSSPAALDTLNELAAALGNDANFATTMTNALAGKQASLGYTPVNKAGDTMTGALSTTQLSINGNFALDSNKLRIPSRSTAPTGVSNGDMYYNSVSGKFFAYYNGVWVGIGNAMPLNGLQFWLPLDGNVNDISGNSRNGTQSGITYTTGPTGVSNTAALITSGDSISVSYTTPVTDKTLCFWYKASWNSQTDAFRIGFQGNNGGNGFMFMQGVGSIYDLGVWGYGATNDYNVGNSFSNIWASNDVWHHIAMVWNGANSLVYLDGIAQNQYYNGSVNSTMTLTNSLQSTFTIDNAASDVSLSGVSFWNRQLSSAEILAVKTATGV